MQIPAFPVLPLLDLNPIETAPAPEAPIRIMALHAMLYCERLFYLEEVAEIRVADANVYAGRRLQDDVVPEDDVSPEKRLFQVESESWGLIGKADAAREDLKQAIERTRELRRSDLRPPVPENERLCCTCSLAPVCLEQLHWELNKELDSVDDLLVMPICACCAAKVPRHSTGDQSDWVDPASIFRIA